MHIFKSGTNYIATNGIISVTIDSNEYIDLTSLAKQFNVKLIGKNHVSLNDSVLMTQKYTRIHNFIIHIIQKLQQFITKHNTRGTDYDDSVNDYLVRDDLVNDLVNDSENDSENDSVNDDSFFENFNDFSIRIIEKLRFDDTITTSIRSTYLIKEANKIKDILECFVPNIIKQVNQSNKIGFVNSVFDFRWYGKATIHYLRSTDKLYCEISNANIDFNITYYDNMLLILNRSNNPVTIKSTNIPGGSSINPSNIDDIFLNHTTNNIYYTNMILKGYLIEMQCIIYYPLLIAIIEEVCKTCIEYSNYYGIDLENESEAMVLNVISTCFDYTINKTICESSIIKISNNSLTFTSPTNIDNIVALSLVLTTNPNILMSTDSSLCVVCEYIYTRILNQYCTLIVDSMMYCFLIICYYIPLYIEYAENINYIWYIHNNNVTIHSQPEIVIQFIRDSFAFDYSAAIVDNFRRMIPIVMNGKTNEELLIEILDTQINKSDMEKVRIETNSFHALDLSSIYPDHIITGGNYDHLSKNITKSYVPSLIKYNGGNNDYIERCNEIRNKYISDNQFNMLKSILIFTIIISLILIIVHTYEIHCEIHIPKSFY